MVTLLLELKSKFAKKKLQLFQFLTHNKGQNLHKMSCPAKIIKVIEDYSQVVLKVKFKWKNIFKVE